MAGGREARDRIQEVKEKEATELDLSGMDLTAVPPEIGQLTNLQALDLHENELTEVPPEIGQLTNLQTLALNDQDPQQEWGGLKKILTPEGHYLWLCEYHAAEYAK